MEPPDLNNKSTTHTTYSNNESLRGFISQFGPTVEDLLKTANDDHTNQTNLFSIMLSRPIELIKMQASTLQRIAPKPWDANSDDINLTNYLIQFAKLLQGNDFSELEILFYISKQIKDEPYEDLRYIICELAHPFLFDQQINWNVLTLKLIPQIVHRCSVSRLNHRLEIPSWNGMGSIKTYFQEIYKCISIGRLHHPDICIREESVRTMVNKLHNDGFQLAFNELCLDRMHDGFLNNINGQSIPLDKLMETLSRIDGKYDVIRTFTKSNKVFPQNRTNKDDFSTQSRCPILSTNSNIHEAEKQQLTSNFQQIRQSQAPHPLGYTGGDAINAYPYNFTLSLQKMRSTNARGLKILKSIVQILN